MTLRAVLSAYIKATPPFVLAIDGVRVLAILLSPFLAALVLRAVATNDLLLAPLHVRLFLPAGRRLDLHLLFQPPHLVNFSQPPAKQ